MIIRLLKKQTWIVIFMVFGSCLLLILWSTYGVSAEERSQEGDDDPLSDPVALGAWLYGGNCVRCHGAYESERVGSDLEAKELEEAIGGDSRNSCQVKWSRKEGGPFTAKEISAIIAYIQAWNETGGNLSLPELPAYPTATPFPTPTSQAKSAITEPTATPRPTLDPQIQLIIEGSSIALGAWLYTENCYRCHLGYEYSRMGAGLQSDRIKRTISNGKAGTSMPAFGWSEGGPLKASETNAIVEYILAWESLESQPALPDVLFVPPTPDPESLRMIPLPEIPPVVGQPDLGLDIYSEHCSSCHGTQGQGAIGPRLAKDWGSIRADLTIRSTIRQGMPGSGMPAWSQSHGGSLSDDQIDNLVALILAWSAVKSLLPEFDVAAADQFSTNLGIPIIFLAITITTLSLGFIRIVVKFRGVQ